MTTISNKPEQYVYVMSNTSFGDDVLHLFTFKMPI